MVTLSYWLDYFPLLLLLLLVVVGGALLVRPRLLRTERGPLLAAHEATSELGRNLFERFGLLPDPSKMRSELDDWHWEYAGAHRGFPVRWMWATISSCLSDGSIWEQQVDRGFLRAKIWYSASSLAYHAASWRCALPRAAPFSLQIIERTLAEAPSSPWSLFGLKYHYAWEPRHAACALGDRYLDARFVARTTDPAAARALLAEPEIRTRLLSLGHVDLSIDAAEVRFDAPRTGTEFDRFDRRIDRSEAGWWGEFEAILTVLVLVASRVAAPGGVEVPRSAT